MERCKGRSVVNSSIHEWTDWWVRTVLSLPLTINPTFHDWWAVRTQLLQIHELAMCWPMCSWIQQLWEGCYVNVRTFTNLPIKCSGPQINSHPNGSLHVSSTTLALIPVNQSCVERKRNSPWRSVILFFSLSFLVVQECMNGRKVETWPFIWERIRNCWLNGHET